MSSLKKRLEKTWFSLLLFVFICLGAFRVFESPRNTVPGASDTTKAPSREWSHVTKPLSVMRNSTPPVSDHVLFFNRVPKTGSEMLVLLLQWLQGANGFRHIRLPGGEKRKLSVLEQEELVEEIINAEKAEAVPVSFDRHVYFVNFTKFDKQSPIYVNLVRDPVEKAVSRFYYGRVTPNPNNPDLRYAASRGLVPTRVRPKITVGSFEDCVASGNPECNFVTGNKYDLSIPYFCGQEPECLTLNSVWALRRAKKNVEEFFAVVGVLEELNSTLALLEARVPMFFKGVRNVYYNELFQPHKNKNRWKPKPIQAEVRLHLKSQLKLEYDFYYWIKARLLRDSEGLARNSRGS